MIIEELGLNYDEMLDSSNINGLTLIWDPLDSKLIVDDKISDILEEYDVKKQDLNQLIDFIHEDDKDKLLSLFSKDLAASYMNSEKVKQRYRVVNKGQSFEFILIGKAVKNNCKYYFIGNSFLISNYNKKYEDIMNWIKNWNRSLSEKKIHSICQCDRITGLPNKYLFKNMVSNLLKDAVKNNKRSAMIIIDLDNFKYVNDSFGHNVGDLLLKEVSSNILESVTEDILVSRYSGDTFILFKHDATNANEVVDLCNNIINSFDRPNIVDGKKIYLTSSIGVALSPDHGLDYNTLLKNADAAMYEAKKNGKNECDFFNDNIYVKLNRTYSLQKGLRTALQNEELYVMFQPKVSLNNSLVNGFEALARWESPEFGFVSPAEFIPIAENSKMIIPIGSFVLEEVFKKTKCLLNDGDDNFKIAVNLSEMQLREDIVLLEFKKLIKKYKINPRYIEVEITESMLMKSFDKNVKILEEIRKLGISIALDDFGTGYSSLNYLTKLPIDVLKIDRSFVTDLMSNPKSKCIVENIINLSHQLGIKVVAEGVEEESQVNYLKTIFCDVVQGYYFSKPRMFDGIKNIVGKEII